MSHIEKTIYSILLTILLAGLLIFVPVHAENNSTVSILFDNAHLQTAGNADWTISGGYSDFADAIRNLGYTVDQFGKDDSRSVYHDSDPDITYDVLRKYKVYIVPEPNDPFTSKEQEAILKYIYDGGTVFFIADHAGADRNRNGWDAVEIFNGWQKGVHDVKSTEIYNDDFVAKLGFRFQFDNRWQSPITDIERNSDIGQNVSAIGAWGASSIVVLSPTITVIARYKDGAPYVVAGTYGAGAFVAIGDSSPFDDGTGTVGDKLYDGWNDYDDAKFAVNVVRYLASYTKVFCLKIAHSIGGYAKPSGTLSVVAGKTVTVSITASVGYHIENILLDGQKVFSSQSASQYLLPVYMNADHKVYIDFRRTLYPVYVGTTKGGTVAVSSDMAYYGDIISYTVSADKGYAIDLIKVTTGSQTITITSNMSKYTGTVAVLGTTTIDVRFSVKKYMVTSVAYEGGSIVPSGEQEKTYGSYVLFTITASRGYHIKNIVVNGEVVYSGVHNTDDVYYLKLQITGTTTIEATFAKDTYTIEARAGEGGSISPSGEVKVVYGESITFYITPEEGYKIKDVKVDGESVGAVEEYTFEDVNANHTIEAEFEKKETVIVLRPGETYYWVNGQMSEMDVAPFIDPRYNRTVVPLRFVAEAMGLSVEWNGETREISITGYVQGEYTELIIPMKNLKKVKVNLRGKEEYLYESDGTVYIGGEERNLEEMGLGKPVIYHSRTMVPIRFIAEVFGAKVDWDGETHTIYITIGY